MEKMEYGNALKIVIDFRVDGPMAKDYRGIDQWIEDLVAYIKDAAEDLDSAAYPGQRKMLVLEYMTCIKDDARTQYHESLSFNFSSLESEYSNLEVFQYTWEEPERPRGECLVYAQEGQNWRVRGD